MGTHRAAPMPTNVRAVIDGEMIPLDLVYIGINEEGVHVWTNEPPLTAVPERVLIDRLPARTTIDLSVHLVTSMEAEITGDDDG